MLKGDSISVNKADAEPVVMSELTAWMVDSLYSPQTETAETEVLQQTCKKSFGTFFDVTSTLIAQS